MKALPEPSRAPVACEFHGQIRTYEGDVYAGALALVRLPDPYRPGWWWSVTHVPTGRATNEYRRKQSALRAIRLLLEIAPAATWRRVRLVRGRLRGLTDQQREQCRAICRG